MNFGYRIMINLRPSIVWLTIIRAPIRNKRIGLRNKRIGHNGYR